MKIRRAALLAAALFGLGPGPLARADESTARVNLDNLAPYTNSGRRLERSALQPGAGVAPAGRARAADAW